MTQLEKQRADRYIPGVLDETLAPNEYYVRDANGRATRARICEIVPTDDGGSLYIMVRSKSGGFINGPWYDGAYRKGEMYDNREDCRAATHDAYDPWEDLRDAEIVEGIA